MTISLQEKKKSTGDPASTKSVSSRNFIGPIKLKPLGAVQPKSTVRSAVNSTTSTSAE